MNILNYAFYKIYNHYSKVNDERFPLFTAAIYISVLEISFLFFIILSVNAIFYNDRLIATDFLELIGLNQIGGKIMVVIFCIVVHFINYLFYKKKITEIQKQYKMHSFNSWFRLWMLYLIGFLFFAIPICIFKLRN